MLGMFFVCFFSLIAVFLVADYRESDISEFLQGAKRLTELLIMDYKEYSQALACSYFEPSHFFSPL